MHPVLPIHPLLIFLSASLYAASFGLNAYFMGIFSHSIGVSWIFLPAGLRLLLVLLLGESGAIGIVIASSIIGIGFFFDDLILAIGAGLISGFAPYLARFLVFKSIGLRSDLTKLNGSQLLNCILIFSIISPVLHQAWFSWMIPENVFFDNLGVMIIGDLIGSLIIVYCAKAFIFLYKKKSNKSLI